MAKQERMIIPRDGISSGAASPRGLYGPAVNAVASALGEKEIARASHVEPGSGISDDARDWVYRNYTGETAATLTETAALMYPPDKWFADLLPSEGPVLGPFDTRELALEAEADWLHAHSIPTPQFD